MKPVATSESVTIFCPGDGKFSFFNSPYPAHRLLTGIDIYPKTKFGEPAPSPVSGQVVKIRRVRCPEGRGYKASDYDFVTLIRSSENPERLVKILHVAPELSCGETVEAGDHLGKLLRTGFFNFWTDPHIHLEVRTPQDPIRARGGFLLRGLLEVDNVNHVKELKGIVTLSGPEYSLITLRENLKFGLPSDVGGRTGLLDGGIPHYGWVGVHTRKPPTPGSQVRLCNRPVATIRSVQGRTGLAECSGISFEVEGNDVGLSLYLSPSSKPIVKLIPSKLGAFSLEESTEISIEVR
jgi:hypothetical protein